MSQPPPDGPEPLMPYNQDPVTPPGQSPYPQYSATGGAAYPASTGYPAPGYQDPGYQDPGYQAPGYPAAPGGYPAPQAYARPQRPLGGLAMTLTVLLGLASVAAVAGAFPHFSRATLLDQFRTTRDVSLADANAADSRVVLFSLIFGALFLATAVVFMIWQYRFASNAQALGQTSSMGAPGWAIGAWFIPLANFLLPSFNLSSASRASGFRLPALVPLWAVAFALAALGQAGANGIGSSALTGDLGSGSSVLDKVAQADRIFGGSLILEAVAGILAILMVRTLSNLQEAAAAARQQPQYPQY